MIGLGGVGSWAAEALVRSGFRKVILVDFDDICMSNTNRQLHTQSSTIGKLKGEVLKERFLSISPEAQIEYIDERFSSDSIEIVFQSKPDIVVDAIDDANLKAILIDYCRSNEIKVVVSGASGGRTNPMSLRLDDLTQTKYDPLLSRVRKLLRQKYGFPRGQKKFNVPSVYSIEDPYFPTEDGCVTQDQTSTVKGPMDCASGFGAVTHLTGSIGFLLAHACIEIAKKS